MRSAIQKSRPIPPMKARRHDRSAVGLSIGLLVVRSRRVVADRRDACMDANAALLAALPTSGHLIDRMAREDEKAGRARHVGEISHPEAASLRVGA